MKTDFRVLGATKDHQRSIWLPTWPRLTAPADLLARRGPTPVRADSLTPTPGAPADLQTKEDPIGATTILREQPELRRRGFAASDAIALGHSGVTPTLLATRLARSTINRSLAGAWAEPPDARRPGDGRKKAVIASAGLPVCA
jgi:hypothetical protein